MSDRAHSCIAAGAAAVVLLSTLATSTPGLFWLDAGDFVTAASTLGVPHATGFPVYVLLGHLVGYLPLGNLAARVGFLSAAFAAVAAWALVAAVAGAGRSRAEVVAAGLAAALAFAAVPTLFIHARVPEVYSLSCALVALALFLFVRHQATPDLRIGLLIALVLGLGAANHALFYLWAPLLAVCVFAARRSRSARFVAAFAALFGAALLAYLYLPAAAVRGPAHNWGDPSTMDRFLAHVTARGIRAAFEAEMTPGMYAVGVHLGTYAGQLLEGIGGLLPAGAASLAAACAAAAASWRRGVPVEPMAGLGTAAALLVLAETCYAVIINPMGLGDLQNGQVSALLLAVAGAVGIVRLLTWLGSRLERWNRAGGPLGIAAVAAGLAPQLGHAYSGLGADWGAEDLAVIHTSYALPDSLTLVTSDSITAPHFYVGIALGARPDAAVVERNLLSTGRRFAYAARRQPFPIAGEMLVSRWGASPDGVTPAELTSRLAAVIRANLDVRPVYFETVMRARDLPPDLDVAVMWPLGRVAPAAQVGVGSLLGRGLRVYAEAGLDVTFAARARAVTGAGSPFYVRFLAGQWSCIGRALYERSDWRRAAWAFGRAVELAPAVAAWHTNLGAALGAMGDLQGALRATDEALALDSLAGKAVLNGLKFAAKAGDGAALARYEERAALLGVLPGGTGGR